MIDVVHGSHSPIFDAPRSKKLPPSFYWGVAFAVLLHLILLYCLFQQNFTLAPVAAEPEDKPLIMTMDRPEPPKPPETKPVQHVNTVVPHTPVADAPPQVATIPVDPEVKPSNEPSNTPPVLPTTPAVTGPATAPGPVYVTARWTRFPDSNALADYYPERAADAEVEGTATVECTVLDAAGRVSCRALSEIPGGYGFGKATVRMVQDKGRVDTTQGNVKIGSILKATIKWTLG